MVHNTVAAYAGEVDSKNILIGRDKEVSQMLDGIQNVKSSTWLITGESGIGKSALLDEIYRRLTNDVDDLKKNTFVGYYSRKESLIAESESLVYPFNIALGSLVRDVLKTQTSGERMDTTWTKIKRGFSKSAKEQGKKIGLAILEDAAKKVGLGQTFEVGKEIIKAIGEEKSGIQLSQSYVTEHKDEARESYLEIFKAILDEFKDRRFVVMFDQFEHVGKASIDFFLNFAKFMMFEERFHIIVSFSTDERIIQEPEIKAKFKELQDKVKRALHGEIMDLHGLPEEEIGKWIKIVRGVSLPMTPDLQRIRENTAGLPMLLEEWIRTSADLNDYESISRKRLCEQLTKLKSGLPPNMEKNLYRLSILQQPFRNDDYGKLASYLEIDDPFEIQSLGERLVENRVFSPLKKEDNNDDTDSWWFRHELIKRCFEDNLRMDIRNYYHDKAARFFLALEKKNHRGEAEKEEEYNNTTTYKNDNLQIQDNYKIAISAAYHLHMSRKSPQESYNRNRDIGDYAARKGDLDLAERCYKRSVKDIQQLSQSKSAENNTQNLKAKEMWLLNDLATKVYSIWGRYNEALSIFKSALEYSQDSNNQLMYSTMLNNIGIIHKNKGEHDQALKLYQQSLELSKGLGDDPGIGNALDNISIIHYNKGEYDQALKLYRSKLEDKRKVR